MEFSYEQFRKAADSITEEEWAEIGKEMVEHKSSSPFDFDITVDEYIDYLDRIIKHKK